MIFNIDENSTFDQYYKAIKDAAKNDVKPFTFSDVEKEVYIGVTDIQNSKCSEGCFRLARALFSSSRDMLKLHNAFYCKLMDAVESPPAQLHDEFLKKKKACRESRIAQHETQQEKMEKERRQAFLDDQKKKVSAIRNSLGHPSNEQLSFNHPFIIKYESCYKTWSMTSKKLSNIHHKGLENLGNTCYMNSIIQSLSATSLADFFLSNSITHLLSHDIAKVRLTNEFMFTIQELSKSGGNASVNPKRLKQCIEDIYEPFKGVEQQDANEFFNVLVQGLHSGLNKRQGTAAPLQIDNTKGSDEQLSKLFLDSYTTNNMSEIVKLFSFQERNAVKCPLCCQLYRSFNCCIGVQLPIPSRKIVCLEDCLAAYCHEETLDRSSLYTCEKCKSKVKASQQLTFYSCPQILVFTLKRFNSSSDFSTKISSEVYFQRNLDLAPFLCSGTNSSKYKLVAIVNHFGSISGGHYTADILQSDNVWLNCSDSCVSEATGPNFSLAYILFYEKMSRSQL